jgi:hypothetical protein
VAKRIEHAEQYDIYSNVVLSRIRPAWHTAFQGVRHAVALFQVAITERIRTAIIARKLVKADEDAFHLEHVTSTKITFRIR